MKPKLKIFARNKNHVFFKLEKMSLVMCRHRVIWAEGDLYIKFGGMACSDCAKMYDRKEQAQRLEVQK